VTDSTSNKYIDSGKSTEYELDVKGMYTIIAIEHNISFETANCRCCKDNPNARIHSEVMDEIN
jgi:DNA polymerase I